MRDIPSPSVVPEGCLNGDSCSHTKEWAFEEEQDLFALVHHVMLFHYISESLSKLHVWKEKRVKVLILIIQWLSSFNL